MGLRTKKFNKNVPFAIFKDKFADYVIRSIKYGIYIENCIRQLEDPMVGLETKHMPTPLTTETPNFDQKFMQQERLKAYVIRENAMKDNFVKVYGVIWGQCSSALQAVIKDDTDYRQKSTSHDLVWMLKQIKKITSGIDVKANPYMTLVDALLSLLNMRQQSSESNDHYVERFNANVQTLNLAKGGHIFAHVSFFNAKMMMISPKLKSITRNRS